MKHLLTPLILLTVQITIAQNYDVLMKNAAEAMQKKDYCGALAIFQNAFKDTARIGTYDLTYAAIAAANCHNAPQALEWLQKSQEKGLGLRPGEIEFISTDSSLLSLHAYPQWTTIVQSMKQAAIDQAAAEKIRAAEWSAAIRSNAIGHRTSGKFQRPRHGFALYFTKVDTLQVPYLVYVPKTYNPAKPMQAIVYLHGGVVQARQFNFQHPGLSQEPVFAAADTFHALIIYPFGKKDFGWVAQRAAFENVLTMIKDAQNTYNINRKRIFIGGMSNGGTATFWFASQRPDLFKGFFAFSAFPKTAIDTINFSNLGHGKPFYSASAKDDDVFPFDTVYNIYKANSKVAADWHFDIIPSGGHGFIYQPNGKTIMNNTLRKLLAK